MGILAACLLLRVKWFDFSIFCTRRLFFSPLFQFTLRRSCSTFSNYVNNLSPLCLLWMCSPPPAWHKQVCFLVAVLRCTQISVVEAASLGLDLTDLLSRGDALVEFDLSAALVYVEELAGRHGDRCLRATQAYFSEGSSWEIKWQKKHVPWSSTLYWISCTWISVPGRRATGVLSAWMTCVCVGLLHLVRRVLTVEHVLCVGRGWTCRWYLVV